MTATVTDARLLSRHVRELTLVANAPVDFAPGQWLSLHLPVGDRPPPARAYSPASPPSAEGRTLTLCFDRVEGGLGSGWLWNAEPGASLPFTGPLGNFVLPPGDGALLVLLARYTGIVPFRAMLQAIDRGLAPKRRVHLVYGAPSAEEQVYHDELSELAARSEDWLEYHPLLLDAGQDEIALLTERAEAWLPFTAMACGVREFTKPVRDLLMERFGFERRAVKVENYNGPTAR